HAAFNLQVKAEFIRRRERRFRRTPRMKPHVVQTIILTGLENLLPRCNVRRRIARQRKITAKMRAAKIDGMAVQDELVSLGVEIAEAESVCCVFIKIKLVGSTADFDSQTIKRGGKFIPKFCLIAEINVCFD